MAEKTVAAMESFLVGKSVVMKDFQMADTLDYY
jgi:hypothetical protein